MKRLVKVPGWSKQHWVVVDRPPVSAHSSLTQPRGMGARTGHTSSAPSSSVVRSPRRGEVVHPFMRALNSTARAGARYESDGGVAQSTGRLSGAATCPNALTPPA